MVTPTSKERILMTIQPTITRPHAIGHGEQRIYRFDNGYGASVVRFNHLGAHNYGGESGLWELAVIKFSSAGTAADRSWEITYDTPVTDDVIGWLDEDGIQEKLRLIRDLPAEAVTAR